jgi:hypothetical protein
MNGLNRTELASTSACRSKLESALRSTQGQREALERRCAEQERGVGERLDAVEASLMVGVCHWSTVVVVGWCLEEWVQRSWGVPLVGWRGVCRD